MKETMQLLGPLDLIALDRKQDRHKAPRDPVNYKTPGLVCPHADTGCCPHCHPRTMFTAGPRMRVRIPGKIIRQMHEAVSKPARSRKPVKRASSRPRHHAAHTN